MRRNSKDAKKIMSCNTPTEDEFSGNLGGILNNHHQNSDNQSIIRGNSQAILAKHSSVQYFNYQRHDSERVDEPGENSESHVIRKQQGLLNFPTQTSQQSLGRLSLSQSQQTTKKNVKKPKLKQAAKIKSFYSDFNDEEEEREAQNTCEVL